ncbi:protein kinase domain-containing protein [Fimbriiglobus ruber]|uniref:non-specific serine/threonine protein kinase n=1 Tax=Fimbriiglobus ruber TaxID=1908690 RepID=A0A225DEL0_9BACT|nr:protein kinase [Fimbriiglobus ruber]OWK39980.1 Serine/threonine protein kinase PrkC, regulator of stationary phase [Fimbriiglobus ruber]
MVERDIFLAALDIVDASARAAYLDGACGGDAERRTRIEALLWSHAVAGSFLDLPVTGGIDPTDVGANDDAEATADPGDGPTRTYEGRPDLAFLAPSDRPDALGRIGHYEALEVVGRGGFGIVLRAFDEVLQRVVAVKVLTPVVATTSPARKRFLREARSTAAVRHPNVVQIHAVEEYPLPHLVMEFVPGETLQQTIDRTGPLEIAEVLRIGRQLAEGLAAAHATGLVHRDVKPANILIDDGATRQVKLTDFGLARATDDASITHSGTVAGTPLYMAPEQAKGGSLDHRVDLFSLGSVLYVMCTGRPPFRASTTLAVLNRVREDQPRPIREVIPEAPAWLCRVIEMLHVKDPAGRIQTAREAADLLAAGERQWEGRQTAGDSFLLTGRKRKSYRFGLRTAVALLIAGVAGATIYSTVLTDRWTDSGPGSPPARTVDLTTPDDGIWVSLFNGKDLGGWEGHPSQTGTWGVEDGVLTGHGPLGYLFNRGEEYDNFHLRIEAKVSAGGNAGAYIRCRYGLDLKVGTVAVPFGYEIEIAPREGQEPPPPPAVSTASPTA